MDVTAYTLNCITSPGQCGSVGWVLSYRVKGRWFDSWSGHMPGLWVRCLVGARMRGDGLMFLSYTVVSLSFSLPSLPSKVNIYFKM